MTSWLIWSNQHKKWRAPDGLGYVDDIREAGRYSFVRATEICLTANSWPKYLLVEKDLGEIPNEVLVPIIE